MTVSVSRSFRNELFFSFLSIYVVTECLADPCVITCSASDSGAQYCDPSDRHYFLTCITVGTPLRQPCSTNLVCVQLSETKIDCDYDTGTTVQPVVTGCPSLNSGPSTIGETTARGQTVATTHEAQTAIQSASLSAQPMTDSTDLSSAPIPSTYGPRTTQNSMATGSHNQTEGQASTPSNIVIIAATTGATLLLVLAGTITFVIIRRRSAARGKPAASLGLSTMSGHLHPTTGGAANQSFSEHTNLDDLHTKPDKKKKKHHQQNSPTPDDLSYQDVLPSGAQHQYATVKDDPHPYTAVRDEPNLYDSIQDDPQYATVQKGRKQAPNVETNPLYGRGSVDNTAYDSVGPLSNDNERAPSVCEMTDNNIYE